MDRKRKEMEKLTIKRVKLEFTDKNQDILIEKEITQVLDDYKASYPDWEHSLDKHLTTLTE